MVGEGVPAAAFTACNKVHMIYNDEFKFHWTSL